MKHASLFWADAKGRLMYENSRKNTINMSLNIKLRKSSLRFNTNVIEMAFGGDKLHLQSWLSTKHGLRRKHADSNVVFIRIHQFEGRR